MTDIESRLREAIAMLLRQLAETSADDGIRAYRRAIAFYAAEFERGSP
ncbi:hypothetical protein [Cohnella sp. REN36]|nr:hypothetical protein [Cohnella sp. REN36]MCC3371765.1 hypothetical protein [Cohnella sp. REN36]